MDRRIVYVGAIPQDTDILQIQRNAIVSMSSALAAIIDVNTIVDGFDCLPTSPASLTVQVTRGSIYSVEPNDITAFGSLLADPTGQLKQGVNQGTQNFTLIPPGTSGFATNWLIQVEFLEYDTNPAALEYFNSANPDAPWTGPNNTGDEQPQDRIAVCQLSAKAGVPAAAGTQVTPTPDVGYTGLYSIAVPFGATTLDTSNITKLPTAPFIDPKLPHVPVYAQSGRWNYGIDTGIANAMVVGLNPPVTLPPAAGGMSVYVKVLHTNTGATTLDFGAGPRQVKLPTGAALTGGELTTGAVQQMVWDGNQLYLQTANATAPPASTGLTVVATTEPAEGDGTSGNPVHVRSATTGLRGVTRQATNAEVAAGVSTLIDTINNPYVTPEQYKANLPAITNTLTAIDLNFASPVAAYTLDVSAYDYVEITLDSVTTSQSPIFGAGVAYPGSNPATLTRNAGVGVHFGDTTETVDGLGRAVVQFGFAAIRAQNYGGGAETTEFSAGQQPRDGVKVPRGGCVMICRRRLGTNYWDIINSNRARLGTIISSAILTNQDDGPEGITLSGNTLTITPVNIDTAVGATTGLGGGIPIYDFQINKLSNAANLIGGTGQLVLRAHMA